jgi:hypothetical protein
MLALLIPGVGMGGGAASVTPPPVVVTQQDAGRSTRRHRRTSYLVKVDDQDFEFARLEAAIEFLQKARVAAEELAAREIEAAIAEQAKTREPVKPPKLKLPKITASSRDLRPAITQTKRDIAAAYERSARDAEIAIYFTIAKRKEQEEDEEILVWLF